MKAYLLRLGLPAIPPPTAATLKQLTRRHQQFIPFENLDVLSKVPLPASPESVVEKLVERGHGGICYELNTAFGALLEQLGFRIKYYSARVVTGGKPSPPFDHMVLRARGPGDWLVDVGFAATTRLPLEWRDGASWVDGGYEARLVRDGRGWRYDRRVAGRRWKAQEQSINRAAP